MELLVLLRFGTFLFEEKAICGVTSGQQRMDGVVSLLKEVSHDDRGKNERFAVARLKTPKRIASFKETKYDVSL